uniref:Circadian clock-controlled protein n=1 Tax=Sipha flava TaxID=143950 RepID=A0A2S2QED0_9HEMI
MSKVIFTCFLVNLLIISCLAASTKDIKKINGLTSHHVTHYEFKLDVENLVQKIQDYIIFIKNIISEPKKMASSITKKICTSEDNVYSKILNGSLKILFEKLIAEKKEPLSDINIPQLPNLRNVYNDKINISDLMFKKSSLKGLENLVISKFDYNVCSLSFDIEMYIPKLEITSTYTLNGIINGSSIFGDGDIIVTIDMLKLNDQSAMGCTLIAFMDDKCKLNMNKPVNLTNEKVTVRMSNLKYQNLSELQINNQINEFIANYNKSNIMNKMEKIIKFVKDYRKKIMNRFNSTPLLGHLYNEILLV